MTEERDRQVVLFTYVAGTTLTGSATKTVKLGTFVQNIGLEGISYDPLTSGFILIKENQPLGIFQTNIDFNAGTATNGSPTTINSINLFDPALTGLLDFADVFALSNLPCLIGMPNYERLLVLSQESGKIINIDRSGKISSSLTIVSDPGNPLTVKAQQHEGLTMDRTWYGAFPPAGLMIGSYTGPGVGLGADSEAVNLYDAAGSLKASVLFGASPAGPSYPTFDNSTGLDNAAISLLSAVGIGNAFTAEKTPAKSGRQDPAFMVRLLHYRFKLTNIVKVELNNDKVGITAYPNPLQGGRLTAALKNISKGTYLLQLYNSRGQQLLRKSIDHPGGSATRSIRLSQAWPTGIYHLRI